MFSGRSEHTISGVRIEANNIEKEQALHRGEINTGLLVLLARVDRSLGAGLAATILGNDVAIMILELERCMSLVRHFVLVAGSLCEMTEVSEVIVVSWTQQQWAKSVGVK